MPNDDEFETLVEACRKAHEVVTAHGTPDMQAFTKALLHALAKEAIRRSREGGDGHD